MSKHRTLDPILWGARILQLLCVLFLLVLVVGAFLAGDVSTGFVLLAVTGFGVGFAERSWKVEQLRVRLDRAERRADDSLHQAHMVRLQLMAAREQGAPSGRHAEQVQR